MLRRSSDLKPASPLAAVRVRRGKPPDEVARWVCREYRKWQERVAAELESPLESGANRTRLPCRVPSWTPSHIPAGNPDEGQLKWASCASDGAPSRSTSISGQPGSELVARLRDAAWRCMVRVCCVGAHGNSAHGATARFNGQRVPSRALQWIQRVTHG